MGPSTLTTPQVRNYGHSESQSHVLKEIIINDTNKVKAEFYCNGCKSIGQGKRLSCISCKDFNLHPFCRTCPNTLTTSAVHPAHHPLRFIAASSLLNGSYRACNVCGDDIAGAYYTCSTSCASEFNVHPPCTQIPRSVRHPIDTHNHPLHLNFSARDIICDVCRGPCSPQYCVYSCTACQLDVHFWCLLVPPSPPAAAAAAAGYGGRVRGIEAAAAAGYGGRVRGIEAAASDSSRSKGPSPFGVGTAAMARPYSFPGHNYTSPHPPPPAAFGLPHSNSLDSSMAMYQAMMAPYQAMMAPYQQIYDAHLNSLLVQAAANPYNNNVYHNNLFLQHYLAAAPHYGIANYYHNNFNNLGTYGPSSGSGSGSSSSSGMGLKIGKAAVNVLLQLVDTGLTGGVLSLFTS